MAGKRRIGEALPMSQRNKLEGMLGERLQENRTVNLNDHMPAREPDGIPETDHRPHSLIDTQELKQYQDNLNLSANALLVMTELLCGRDGNMTGLFRIKGSFSTLASRLKLKKTEVEMAFRELEAHDMALLDPDAEVFLVREFFKHNPFTNRQMAVRAGHVLSTIPDNALFRELATVLEELIQHEREVEIVSKKPSSSTLEADNPSDWYGHLARQLREKGPLDKQVPRFIPRKTPGTGERTGKKVNPQETMKPFSEKTTEKNRERFWRAVESIKENRRCFWQAVETLSLAPDDQFVTMAKEFTDKSTTTMESALWKEQLEAFVQFGEDVGIDALQEMMATFFRRDSGPGTDHGIASFISENKAWRT